MTNLNFESLSIVKMASGHLCLNLTDQVSWENFPAFSEIFLATVGGQILERNDAPDMRLWKVGFGTATVSLVFDDYPMMISLEAYDLSGSILIERIHDKLSKI